MGALSHISIINQPHEKAAALALPMSGFERDELGLGYEVDPAYSDVGPAAMKFGETGEPIFFCSSNTKKTSLLLRSVGSKLVLAR